MGLKVRRTHNVDLTILKKNLQAIQLYSEKLKTDPKNKNKLFEDAAKISLQIDFIMVPELKNKSYFFDTAKAPVFDPETSEVCLIVKDNKEFQKKHEKVKYNQSEEQTKLFKTICPYVTNVLPFNVIKSDFKGVTTRCSPKKALKPQ